MTAATTDGTGDGERRYQQLFANMAAGFALHEIICDDHGVPCDYRYLEVNPAFERLTGLKAADLVGRRLREVLPATEERWISFFGKVALTGEPAEIVDYSRALDRWHEVRAFCPKPRHFAVIFTEVTDRKRAEERIVTSERTHREIFNATSEALFIHDVPDGTIIDVNTSACAMFGCTREQALAMTIADLSSCEPPYAGEHARAWLRRTVAEGPQTFPWRSRRRDGSLFWAEVSLRCADIGGIGRIIASVRDVTISRQNEIALAESSRRLQVAMDAAQFAIWEWDIPSNHLAWDARMHRIYGTDPEGPPPSYSDWLGLVHPEDRQRTDEAIRAAIANERVYDVEFRVLRANRSEAKVKADGVVMRAADGQALRMVGFNRDVTAVRAMEDRLRQSQKIDAIGQLAGGIAHDFNNVLSGILGASDLLYGLLPPDPRAKRCLHIIQDAAERAAGLTQKLLSFARKQPARLEVLDLHVLVRDMVGLLEHTIDRRIRIDLRLAAPVAMIHGDAVLLQSAIVNLGINAAHAMEDGGTLTLATRAIDLDPAACRVANITGKPGAFIVLEVHDTGHGIPPDVLPHIFEPFFTTKPVGQGTGLGLSTVFGTVSQHGGAITVRSEPGSGTCFEILLPLHAAAPAPVVPAAETVMQQDRGLILVVDDEALLRVTAREMLEFLGYTVLTAADGREGLDIFAKHHADIDVVLLDMVMPVLSGRDCFIAMREIQGDARIVITSGFLRDDDLTQLLAAGVSGCLRKPYRAKELGDLLKTIVPADRERT
jgi:PAS domain S-box-containing protein